MRWASGLSEKTGTHHSGADGDEADRDEKAKCIVAIAVGSSATAVVVDRSAPRRSTAAFRLCLEVFGRVNDGLRTGVIRSAMRDMW